MKDGTFRFRALLIFAAMFVAFLPLRAQQAAPTATVPVKMTVTANVSKDKRAPEITKDDVMVKKGKEKLQVSEWTPAQGERGGLELFILIDEGCDPGLGGQLNDLRHFINTQLPATAVGVGYMSNAATQILQNFTTDHAAAAKVLRLPRGNVGAFGSPYLSVVDLMKRWPASTNRHEVVMVTDGIDRARGGPRFGLGVNPDVDTAGDVAQRTGTIIYTIYFPGNGRLNRNYWEANNGQIGISKLSDVTGGETYYLGTQTPVSFKPYFDQIQSSLSNQYILVFLAKPGKKAGLQYVKVSTEIAGVELSTADAAWVAAAP
jgi:hypothetical protein